MDRFRRFAPTDDSPTAVDANTFRFVFSSERVGRDGHVVLNKGIQTDNYRRNNIVLFAHDDKQPPVGRGTNIDCSGINCRIDVTFASDVLPFAKTLRDLVSGKWLRALSMSWAPIEWEYSSDRNRPGGINFTAVDLLEISVVPLPALPDALLDARSHGVDTVPLYRWAEQKMATRGYDAVPRPELERIARSAKPPRTRSQLRRRAEELAARCARDDRAADLAEKYADECAQ